MSIELKWLGHGGWQIATGEHTVLLDPFLNDCPTAACKADDIAADFILVSHGHFDHIADVPAIAKRTGAQVISIFEIAQWLEKNHQIEGSVGMNIGGGVTLPFGHVKMTPALHSSQLPDGSYGGEPAGFLLTIGEKRLYFACDTALFSDMQLIAAGGLDLAVLPIGDLLRWALTIQSRRLSCSSPKESLRLTSIPGHRSSRTRTHGRRPSRSRQARSQS